MLKNTWLLNHAYPFQKIIFDAKQAVYMLHVNESRMFPKIKSPKIKSKIKSQIKS